jgi:D-cysteine desulfhydrase family pyridoxal phosphate-dependent enzyme
MRSRAPDGARPAASGVGDSGEGIGEWKIVIRDSQRDATIAMTPAVVRAAFANVRRIPLATLPTPLHELSRLREALGGASKAPRIFAKRDDLTGLALGGNKARKLEFLVADAIKQGANVLITTGATQSNHARMTAAAARMAGLDCHLVLTSKSDDPPLEGNLLLDRVYGATVHHVPAPADPKLALGNDEQKVREVDAMLRAAGKKPYVIPVGGSSAVGTLGYTLGTVELVEQLSAAHLRPARLYYASGSRGTQAGLTLGAKACGAGYRVYGVAVSTGEPEKTERAFNAANGAAELLGISTRVTYGDLSTDNDFIGEGYGIPTRECLEAITLLAHTEGILLDPCYTGKAMAGLIAHVRRGEVKPNEDIVFLHTGGAPGMFTTDFARRFVDRSPSA